MKHFVKALSPRTEFIVVVIVAFGYFILGSLLAMLSPVGAHISEAGLEFLLGYEIIVFIVLGLFLYLRDWHVHDLGLMPTLKDSLMGLGLALLGYIVYVMVWLLFGHFVADLSTRAANMVIPNLSFTSVMAVSIVNPMYEEVFVCGYIITALKRSRGLWFAVNVSVAVRLAYHLYQGAFSLINIIPMGIIYAYWYARSGRLWPLVIAHGIFDFIALVYYVKN